MQSRGELIKLDLKRWEREDCLIFNINFEGGNEDFIMEFVEKEGEPSHLKPFDIEYFEFQINKLENIYDEELRGKIDRWFIQYVFNLKETFEQLAVKELKKILPIQMSRKKENNEEIVEFIINKTAGIVEEFELIYYPKKNKIADSSSKVFLNKNNFKFHINNDFVFLVESKCLSSLFTKALEKEAKIWISKEREIRLGSLYS